MADFKYSAGIDVNLNIKGASNQLKDLQKQLQQISNMKVDIGTGNLTANIEKASEAAMKLSAHLATATNPQTGNLDFTKFYSSIQKSGASLQEYGQALQNMGPVGQKAFVSLADSISKSEIPLKRTSKLVDGMWDNLKKTVGWQISSSMIHGFIGSIQQAMGYAKDLNKSLTDIRIVTGQSSDQMATFAREANKAAKSLSTTTTDYTKASLIYYQQGLNDAEVKARTETTIKMANATGTSAQKVSDQMTAIWNNYDNGTKSLTHYADVMTALGAATASSTDEIAEGLQKFASISDTVGLSYEYAASALATITATSRESADVVGNSLKTLFSRIQGLQLGETLDDGTTLNKYSTAMAKVGISIKDSSGELKSMDSILNEMGTTWKTLANDEKMALAQTVAGVRQYTQLMTLMENWDFFKQNLNVANTSGGTLDAQAAIYAESWEAASNRVRTSWEGLWDNLINSDGFIAALDGISGIINLFDNIISGVGGAGGALLTFGGVLTKVFSRQITEGIQNVGYSISMMTSAGRKKISNERTKFLENAMVSLDKDNVKALGHEYEYSARQSAIRQSLGLSYDYAKKGDKLSETQLLQYNMQKKSLEALQQDSIQAGINYDAAIKRRSDLYWKIANDDNISSGLGSNSIANLDNLKRREKEVDYAKRERIKQLQDDNIGEEQKKTLLSEINNTMVPLQQKLNNQIRELSEGAKLTSDIISTGRSAESQRQAIEQLEIAATESEKAGKKILETYKAENAQEFLNRNSSENEELKQAQEDYKMQIARQAQYRASADRIRGSKVGEIDSYSKALINQAKAANQFRINMQQAFENNDISAFTSGLEEFRETSSNAMSNNSFLKTLIELKNGLNEEDSDVQKAIMNKFGDQFLSGLEKFMSSSMDKVSGAIYDQLSINDQNKFNSKEDFQTALRDAYSGVEIADSDRKRKAEQAKAMADKTTADLNKPYQESQSGTERLVKGAAAAMEALAAGESIKALWTSVADGTATLTSVLSGISSSVLNAGSAFTGLQSALTGLGNISASTAGWIAGIATALTMVVSTAIELHNKATVSDKEHQQNLINSSNELNAFAATTADHLETVKAQNEDYLEGVKKIKSFDQDPTTLAEDIFESNKKALNLINEYGLTKGQYSTGANGLIEIDGNVLKQYGEITAQQSNTLSEYANIFGQASVDKTQAENNLQDSKNKNLADVSALLSMENNILSEDGKDILRNILDIDSDGILDSMSLNGEQVSQMMSDGTWNKLMKESAINSSYFDNIKQIGLDYDKAAQNKVQADLSYDSSLQVLSNKILQDAGYNSANTDGYLARSGMMSDLIQQQIESQGDWLDTKSTAGLTYEQQEEAVKLIGSQLGVSNIRITGVDEQGQIKYQQGNDESTASTITKESLNSLYAMSEVMKDTSSLISQVNTKYQDQIDAYGKAGEVVANLDIFDTALGASASAVKAFMEDTEGAQKAKIEQEDGNIKTAGEIFKDSGLSDEYNRILTEDDGIVSQLELGAEVLDNVSMSTLDSLQQVMDVDESSMQGIKDLFTGIQEIDNDPEKAAQLLTALSSMDFSGNAYLNATNLLGVLEDLGYDVNEGNLPAIYAWLAAITGLSPGSEDFAETNKSISKKRGALNGIEPGSKVDTAAKEAAENAGLRGDWVKSGENEYTYTGTQEQIDSAKSNANKAWAKNQENIVAQQERYENLPEINNMKDFATTLGYGYLRDKETGEEAFAKIDPDNTWLQDIANDLGIDSKALEDSLAYGDSQYLDQFRAFLQSITPKAQSEGAEDFMTNITSAQDMMNAVNDAKNRGDTAGFVDENQIISDAAITQLELLSDTSERTRSAYESLRQTQDAYQAAKNTDNQSYYENLVKEAEANYDLASAIDEVANARGLDAEQLANEVAALEAKGYFDDVDSEGNKIGNLTGKDKANLTAEVIEEAEALQSLNDEWSDLSKNINNTKDFGKANQSLDRMGDLLAEVTRNTKLASMSAESLQKGYKAFLKEGGNMSKVLAGNREEIKKLAKQMNKVDWEENWKDLDPSDGIQTAKESWEEYQDYIDEINKMAEENNIGEGLITAEDFGGGEAGEAALQSMKQLFADAVNTALEGGATLDQAFETATAETGMEAVVTGGDATEGSESTFTNEDTDWQDNPHGTGEVIHLGTSTATTSIPSISAENIELVKIGNAPKTGGKGGGGGGGKGPKKVANKRKSQTVKRYKRNDAKRDSAQRSKKSEENKKDYLYGESKIAQMEKINKLAEKEAKITADRIKESQKYLVEDRQNLIKYMQKYGFEAEFDSDGFLANYEETWTKLYEELAALYEDNELTADEEKLEEEINIKLEELEGALEDYENSLSELADDIEKYEESLYEMFDNKVEQLQHKVEFKIELEEDDMSYLDFWIESLGDSVTNSLEAIEAMGAKANALFKGLEVYQQGIEDIYALSDDPLHTWATGGLEDVLTQDQVDALRENRDGLADYMQQLVDLREEIRDKVLDTFDLWQERIDTNISSLEHYSSVIEHFKNIIDIVGKDPFGLSDQFMDRIEQSAINQSMDSIEANKAYYESLQEQQLRAQEELNDARARGDESSAEHWEEVVRTTTESMESAQDALLSSLENTLTLIAEQFETAMQRAVDAFNESIYQHGGIEGLSNDYAMIRENADLMAADYEKIYELSKLTRDINKVLDDTNIVAGKKKMNSLLKEINELQADGVELSKYDLEYLRAKYELRLAEIELENTQNAKDTVRLSKDSEGNWSYVYTQNVDAVEEAEQKYEDALYEMQNLSQEYLEEMSSSIIDTSMAMMEEISALRIQDFTSYEAYQAEVKRIQDKYTQSLHLQENEMNKAVKNSADLYEQDWQAYNLFTGYKISEADKWVDQFSESTLGNLLNSDTFLSSFSDTFLGLTDQMSESLANAAMQYFKNVDEAMNKYGTTISSFGTTATTTIDNISNKSKTATTDVQDMAEKMSEAFEDIADEVSEWQETFSKQIDEMLEKIKTLIQEINGVIEKSAQMTDGKSGAGDLIGTNEAVRRLNEAQEKDGYDFGGTFAYDEKKGLTLNGKATAWAAVNAKLIEEIDAKMAEYTNIDTTNEGDRERVGKELKELFKKYHAFKDIVNLIYDPNNVIDLKAPDYTSMDTGGYTGEWGSSGKFAMLHEKELVLNANDTANFLDALNISRDLINSMIEMNAHASSLGFGELSPSNVPEWNQTLEQTVTITAEFPDATDHNEIEEAFNNLLNTASQYANRNNI